MDYGSFFISPYKIVLLGKIFKSRPENVSPSTMEFYSRDFTYFHVIFRNAKAKKGHGLFSYGNNSIPFGIRNMPFSTTR